MTEIIPIKMAKPAEFKFRKKKPAGLLPIRVDQSPLRSQSENITHHPNNNPCDIYEDHWLVESPRKVQFERTTLGIESPISTHLDMFYDSLLEVRPEVIERTHDVVTSFVEYLLPRLKKLGNKLGFKILDVIYAGSTFDDTYAVNIREIDLFILFKKPPTALHNMSPGYKYIPLKKYVKKDGSPPDPFRFGRSVDGMYLSPVVVAQNIHSLIERALRLHSYAELQDFLLQDGCSPSVVILKKKYKLNLTPAAYLESDRVFLVTRPYCFDENPQSDAIWRMSHIFKERMIISRMDKADRGVRRKAYRLLKALVKVEPTLEGLNTYHLKTVLLNTFDDTVDHILRWQRDSVDTCFTVMLKQLELALSHKHLPNFFIKDQNLFSNMNPRVLNRLSARVSYLIGNQNELLRVLKKRSQ